MEGGQRACNQCGEGLTRRALTVILLGENMRHVFIFFIALITLIAVSYSPAAFADDPPEEEEAKQEEAAEGELCRTLDYRHRFSKKHIGEIDVFFGNYLGDFSQNTWSAGGRAYFHINHVFALGAEYNYSHIRVDSTSSFGRILQDKNQHILNAQLMINNEILFAAGKKQIPMDLYLTVGAGSLRINRQWKWLASIGGGVKVYLKPKWMALRIDVNSYIHPTPTATGNQIAGDVSFLFGLAFHFPYRPPTTN